MGSDEDKTDLDPTGAAGPVGTRPRRWRFRGKLQVRAGGCAATEFFINRDNYVIGRDDGCSLTLDDEEVSRFHARLVEVGDAIHLEDLDSKNGTRINGGPIRSVCLTSGDEIEIGDTRLTFIK